MKTYSACHSEQLSPATMGALPGPIARPAGRSLHLSVALLSRLNSLPVHHGHYQHGLHLHADPPSPKLDSLAIHSLHQAALDLLRPQRLQHALPPVLPPLQVDHEDL